MSIPLKRNQVLGLEQLDERLDVPVSRFSATVQKLVRIFRSKDLRLRVTRPTPVSGSVPSLRSAWTRLYEAEVGRLPRMDRAEEFRMARRYEFLRARAKAAAEAAGFPGEEAEKLVKQPHGSVPNPPGRSSQPQRRYQDALGQDHAEDPPQDRRQRTRRLGRHHDAGRPGGGGRSGRQPDEPVSLQDCHARA